MKKKLSLLLVAVMLLSVCAPFAFAEDWKFTRKVDIICPWGVGGGADSTIRPMANLLKDQLGVQVDVINVEGAGGVNGVEHTNKQPADGYTFMLGTQSLIMQDLQGTTSMDYKNEFVPVAKLVHSINIIAGSKKALDQKGIKTFSDLIAYAKANPFTINVGLITTTGGDGAALQQTIEGLDVMEITYPSGSEMNSAMVGGHVDIMVSGITEIEGLIESGDIFPILALSENRMKRFPDVECSGELGIDSYIGTWRGVYAKKGTPQGAIDAMIAGLEKAVATPEWQDFLVQGVYDERVGFLTGDGLLAFVESEYKIFTEFLRAQGILSKDYYK